ncbi:MAG: shikimate dehydrogenase [Pseudomonadales bacterium]|nr:shikimate dehydrogenase [Pseudomonadales bacterium]
MTQYAVVGDPIAHSKSPQIHALFAEQTGQAVDYNKHQVSAAEFKDFVLSFFADGGGGLNITLPHKEAAFSLAQQHSSQALLAKAANTLWMDNGELWADNTDGKGIVRDLHKNNGIELKGKRLLVLGAGGAARGALAALIETSPASVIVLNRTFSRARALQSDFSDAYLLEIYDYNHSDVQPCDVVINATSMSIGGAVPPVLPSLLADDCCCYDMMYGKEPTPFMQWARDNNARQVLDGLGMLVEQAAESFFLWRGVRPDTAPVISALRTQL